MADIPKLDLHEGSSYRVSLVNGFQTRAIRRGRITGLGNTNQDLGDAVTAIGQDASLLAYQADSTLPLNAIEARKYGPDRAWVRLEYRRTPLHLPSAHPATLATFEDILWPLECFASPAQPDGITPAFDAITGMPQGPLDIPELDETNKDKRPRAYRWQRRALHVIVGTVLNFSPYAVGVGSLVNRVNSGPVTFTGALGTLGLPGTYGFASVLFVGARVRFVESTQSPTGFLFPTDYVFIIVNGQHMIQRAVLDSGVWIHKDILSYQTASFAGVFPV